MKHLNIISKPVERWFHYEKPFPIEMPRDLIPYFVKDHQGNDVMCWFGWGTYKCDGAFYNGESGGF